MIGGRGGGGVIRPQIPEKKMWSRLCSREDELGLIVGKGGNLTRCSVRISRQTHTQPCR